VSLLVEWVAPYVCLVKSGSTEVLILINSGEFARKQEDMGSDWILMKKTTLAKDGL